MLLGEALAKVKRLNEEDYDPEQDKDFVDNEGEELPLDQEDQDGEGDEEGEDDKDQKNEGDLALENLEMKFADALIDSGLDSVEAEQTEDEIIVDLVFADEKVATVQMYLDEEQKPKVAVMVNDLESEEMDLPDSFVQDGKLVLDLENLPMDQIKENLLKNLNSVPDQEQVVECFRLKNGIVESVSKTIKFEKNLKMKYKNKKESKGKKKVKK